jgi:hypothetical protein
MELAKTVLESLAAPLRVLASGSAGAAARKILRSVFMKGLEALIRSHVIHAPRRLQEIEKAARRLHNVGLGSR